MVGFPGWNRGAGESPQSSCGCIVIGAIISLLVAAALIGFAFYVTDQMEAGWHIK
jgi:hypothetical protein